LWLKVLFNAAIDGAAPINSVLAEGPLLDTRPAEYLAERLAAVPGVVAVTLGGCSTRSG
jgi:hypothetical protein